jgi:hypothetical protein
MFWVLSITLENIPRGCGACPVQTWVSSAKWIRLLCGNLGKLRWMQTWHEEASGRAATDYRCDGGAFFHEPPMGVKFHPQLLKNLKVKELIWIFSRVTCNDTITSFEFNKNFPLSYLKSMLRPSAKTPMTSTLFCPYRNAWCYITGQWKAIFILYKVKVHSHECVRKMIKAVSICPVPSSQTSQASKK